MAEVYLAHDAELERNVALKILLSSLSADPEKRKRFRSAARAASSLIHAHICVIHDVGETEDGRPYLAMEYVEGEPLDQLLSHRKLGIRQVVELGAQVAEALEAAHTHGIVHRDIKPANIIVTARNKAKVLDFGLAKRFGEEPLSELSTSVFETKTGVMIGTPHYMSPEQVLGREVDGRTDLFSLGVVLYEALSGQRPFLGRSVGEVINNVVNQAPEPLALGSPIFSPRLEALVAKCLHKDPQQRYPSARALAEELNELKVARPPAPPEVPYPRPQANVPAEQDCECVPTGFRRRALVGAAMGVTILGVIALGLLGPWGPISLRRQGRGPEAAAATSTSIAVLPFDNFSGESGLDYLSDGLTEEITTALSRIPGWKVAARNSAFTYKGRKDDIRAMGQALGVSTLLEGSVRKDGKRIRVSAQLINANTRYHIWSETYDRPIDDVLAVQREIADRIAEKLQGKAAPMVVQGPADPEAHRLYLQARMAWNKRTEPDIKLAAQLFQGALERDASYAAAQAGLAATYLIYAEYVPGSKSAEYRPLARAAAERALQLDANSAEAHAVLAMLLERDGDLRDVEVHYQRAIELDSSYATAHHWYGNFLLGKGKREQALAEYKKAAEIDPLSPIIHSLIPQWYLMGQEYDQAIASGQAVAEKFPRFAKVYEMIAMARIGKGDYARALEDIDHARQLQPEASLAFLETRGFCLARLGQTNEARQIVARFEELSTRGQRVEPQLGILYVGLRDYDRALDLFEQYMKVERFDPTMVNDPCIKEVLDLPRFKSLLERMGVDKPPQQRT